MPVAMIASPAHVAAIRSRDAQVFAAMVECPAKSWRSDCRSLGAAAGVAASAAYCTMANSLGVAVAVEYHDASDPRLVTHFRLRADRLADVRAFIAEHQPLA